MSNILPSLNQCPIVECVKFTLSTGITLERVCAIAFLFDLKMSSKSISHSLLGDWRSQLPNDTSNASCFLHGGEYNFAFDALLRLGCAFASCAMSVKNFLNFASTAASTAAENVAANTMFFYGFQM